MAKEKKETKAKKPASWMTDDVIDNQFRQQCVLMMYIDKLKQYADPSFYMGPPSPELERYHVYMGKQKGLSYSTMNISDHWVDEPSMTTTKIARLPSNDSFFISYINDENTKVNDTVFRLYNLKKKRPNTQVIDVLNSLTTLQLSSLVPNISVQKIVKGSKSQVVSDGVYTLNLHGSNESSLDDYFAGKRDSIGGFGVKSLSLKQETSEKTNYGSSRYVMELKLVFNSMQDLKRQYVDSQTNTKYTALDVLVGFTDSVLNNQTGPLTYLNKFKIGYDISSIDPTIFPSKINNKDINWKDVLEEVNLDLFANAYKWDIEIVESGKIEVVIHYIGFNLVQTNNEYTNVLFTAEEMKKFKELEKQKSVTKKGKVVSVYKDQQSKARDLTGKEKKERLETINRSTQEFLKTGYTRLVKDLVDKKGVKFAYVDTTQLTNYDAGLEYLQSAGGKDISKKTVEQIVEARRSIRKSKIIVKDFDGKYDIYKDHIENVDRAISGKSTSGNSGTQKHRKSDLWELAKKELSKKKKKKKGGVTKKEFLSVNESGKGTLSSIPYFYFRDIVASAATIYYHNMKYNYSERWEDSDFGNPRIANINVNIDFGMVEIKDPVDSHSTIKLNIGDFPIAYDMFTRWFNHFITKTKTTIMSLRDFIESCLGDIILPTITADQCFYTGSNPWNKEGAKAIEINLYDDVEVSEDFKNVWSKFYLYSSFRNQKKSYKSIKDDKRDGVIWLAPGRDRGIVKSIKFKKDTSSLLKSHLMVKAMEGNNDDKVTQIREIYNVSVTTIGNAFIQTGSTVCVQPSLIDLGNIMDPDNLSWRILGMGGYYNVVSAELNFENGKYDGSFEGVWQRVPLARKENKR